MAGKLMIESLKDGCKKQGYMLLQKIEERQAKNGPYCELTLSDGTGSIKAKKWNCSKDSLGLTEKSIVGIEISAQNYNSVLSFTVERSMPADPGCKYTIMDFVERAPIDPQLMYKEILRSVNKTINGLNANTLAGLTVKIYEQNKEKLLYWSAAESIHHNMYAGLLYHTYRMVKQAEVLIQVYPSLNAELLLSAVALHDIGKLKELETDAVGSAGYSVEGQLFGHALIGIQMIDEMALTGNYNEEKIMCLKHCIASHHGKLEWGAITVPHMEEAAVLHYIDMIDSRIQQYEKNYEKMEPGTISESKIFGLDNVKIYKHSF